MKLTDEEARSIAKELGLRYDGIQEGFGDIPTQYQFTDIAVTGTTFYGNTLRAVKAKLAEKRELFKEAEVTNPVNAVLPMPPDQGPPLPKALGIHWPWKK